VVSLASLLLSEMVESGESVTYDISQGLEGG